MWQRKHSLLLCPGSVTKRAKRWSWTLTAILARRQKVDKHFWVRLRCFFLEEKQLPLAGYSTFNSLGEKIYIYIFFLVQPPITDADLSCLNRRRRKRKHDGLHSLSNNKKKREIHALIYMRSKWARGGTGGGDLNSRAVSTILDCIDHSLLPTHASSPSLPFCPSLSLSLSVCFCHLLRSAISVWLFPFVADYCTLLYNNFLPPLALLLKNCRRRARWL